MANLEVNIGCLHLKHPILPPLMVCIYVQHDNAAPGGNSDIVCTAAAPPLRNFGRVCGSVFAAVCGCRYFSVAGEYPQAHILSVVIGITMQ